MYYFEFALAFKVPRTHQNARITDLKDAHDKI